MTSALTGQVHRYTLPLGHLQAQYASKLKSEAGTLLAPCVGEMIQKTSQPFIQAITDLVTPQAVFCGGKVLLAGDALATLRPMSALGMNAAARSAVGLKEVVDGRKEVAEWERELLELAEWSRGVGEQRCGLFNLKKSAEEAEAAEFLKVDRL
jgi:2-polyprenyl-6-methoxyphenol hydroxylase-like FAD-dependent oxidoreductase